jgi:hypothetical protein
VTDHDLVMNRWRRWGKDRLYVQRADGAKVGYWDLAEDVGHPESVDCDALLISAVSRWRARTDDETPDATADAAARAPGGDGPVAALEAEPQREPEPEPDPRVSPVVADHPEPPPPARPWVDLSTNLAGAEARDQARAARDAAPVRTVLARVLGVHTDERAWRIGADGEEKVAAQLGKVEKKDSRWRFLHAVPVGGRGSDIDHVVIGPGGVFTINAKHHPDATIWVGGSTFIVNGSKQPYVRNARHEAQRASRLLTEACGFPVHVEGLVVPVNAKSVTVKSQPDGVCVIPRMQLSSWLLRHGCIHTDEQVAAMYEVARRSTTWR